MQLDALFAGLGLSRSSIELLTLVFVMFFVSVIFWLLIGRFRLHNFLINTYISYALVQVMPTDALAMSKYAPIVLFFLFIVVLTLMNEYLFDIHQTGSGLALWQVFMMSFLEVGLLLSIIVPYVPQKELLKVVSKEALLYFSSPWAKVGWMAVPLVFLVVVNKRGK